MEAMEREILDPERFFIEKLRRTLPAVHIHVPAGAIPKDGAMKVLEGITTIEEVYRVSQA